MLLFLCRSIFIPLLFISASALAFTGNWANIVRYFPTTAFNFAFKDTYNKIFCPYDAKLEPLKFFMGNLLSGGLAGKFARYKYVNMYL